MCTIKIIKRNYTVMIKKMEKIFSRTSTENFKI